MNFLKEFFEHWRRYSEPLGPKDIPPDILSDIYGDSLNEENTQETFKSYNGLFGSPMDFMSDFEKMFDNFSQGFPGMEFSQQEGNEPQEPWKSPGSKKSLQERMLNDKEKDSMPNYPAQLSQFPFSCNNWRNKTSPYNSQIKREDKNLDEDFQKGDKSLDDMLPSAGENQATQRSSCSFSYSSSTMTRKRDGTIETKKTVRDSSGNEQVTITRKGGHKEYTISHRTDENDTNKTRESVDGDTDQNHFGMLTPGKPPNNDRQSSFYDRLRSWFDDDKD